eukprot:scaffold4193_cov110-Isochrysis_galbana.AAC.4
MESSFSVSPTCPLLPDARRPCPKVPPLGCSARSGDMAIGQGDHRRSRQGCQVDLAPQGS